MLVIQGVASVIRGTVVLGIPRALFMLVLALAVLPRPASVPQWERTYSKVSAETGSWIIQSTSFVKINPGLHGLSHLAPSKTGTDRTRRTLNLLSCLAMSGDVSPNPGPRASRFPCGICLQRDERAQTRSGILPREAWQLILWFEQSWDDVKRNEFLHKLLLKLDPRQHYFISSYLSVKQYRDFITLLPEHLALKILSYLKPTELLSASRVSQAWNRIISDQGLWRVKCYETVMKLPITAHVQDWKKLYKDNWFLQRNWDIGRCRITEIRGHSDKVLSVAFEGRRMASGSADKLVRVWDIKTGNLLHTLKGHTKGIWCLQFFTKHLILSGSYDSTIKIWNLRTNTCARTLFGHEGPVWALVRKDVMMVTGSQDKTAKIWEIRRCRLAHTLKGHSAAVFAVDMDDDCTIVITGSADRSIRIWSCESGRSLKTIWASHTTSIMTVSYHRGFFACSAGGMIFLWNLKTATCIKKFHEHEKRVEKLQLQITNPEKVEGLMVSAGKDGMIKYWDISKDKSIQTMRGHKGQINCIQFDETKMATASADGKIRVWDFHISSKTDTNVVRVKDYVDPT